MDHASQQLFDNLTRKEPHELTQSDIEFLRARVSYLTGDQRALFGATLGLDGETAASAEEPAKPAKAKKPEK